MRYKIYILQGDGNRGEDEIQRVIEPKEFVYDDFETMEDAFDAINRRGVDYCNYTILPYIYML